MAYRVLSSTCGMGSDAGSAAAPFAPAAAAALQACLASSSAAPVELRREAGSDLVAAGADAAVELAGAADAGAAAVPDALSSSAGRACARWSRAKCTS